MQFFLFLFQNFSSTFDFNIQPNIYFNWPDDSILKLFNLNFFNT